ncbi:MAG: type II toxin-antitoxin system RelE/ParE family toxin [Myxococcaceae bacterium]|nr:type II toxin-antitoxin system RelE/ParE family toxin [Myxococcaceae bacterium]MCI0673120.1 type II toxin-antitoxin system RelE/ParE family toxin [Myxococcaceae bacterium]
MITSFADKASEDIFNGTNSKEARQRLPRELWPIAQRKLDLLNSAQDLRDLTAPPSNRLELLKGALAGRHSIRINDQYRVVFTWTPGKASEVQIVDYH